MDEVETDDREPETPEGNATSPEHDGATPRRRRRRRRRGRHRAEGAQADASAQQDASTQQDAGTQQDAPHTDANAQGGAATTGVRAGASAQTAARPDAARASSRPHVAREPHDRDRPRPPRHHDDAAFAHERPRPPSRDVAAFATLSAGLFSHLDDREVGCKVEGCTRTWTWTAAEQIQAFGQPPPKRMCAEHHAAFHTVADREIPCTNPWCERTWTWTKAAQLSQLSRERGGSIEPPARTCDTCAKQDRELADAEVACRVEGCKRTWTWTREAQLKHRMWLRHAGARDGETAGDEPDAEGRRRRRKHRRGRASDGPPPRMCEPCRQRQAKLVERETTCRVHGCTRTVTIDRESQLRAWAALGTDDVNVEAPLPKRMCEVCREFCRLHADREVPCGRPGCERTWTFKTGAQLQAFLAGRFEDPLRLCGTCLETGHLRAGPHGGLPDELAIEGAEIMPCIVSLCDGIWHYVPSMSIAPCDDGDLPLDRMCDRCRVERGATPRRQTDRSTNAIDPVDPEHVTLDAIADDHDRDPITEAEDEPPRSDHAESSFDSKSS